MLTLLHWSDLHIGAGESEARALARLVKHACANYTPHSTAVLITGDLTECGKAGEYSRCRVLLLPLVRAGFTVLAVPGNHDCGGKGLRWDTPSRARFDSQIIRPLMGGVPVRWPIVWRIGGWRFLLLDSCAGNHDDLVPLARGEIGAAQLARLEVELQDEREPTVIALHHHPLRSDVLHALDEADDLVAMCARREQARAVLFGHMHRRAEFHDEGGVDYAADAGKTTEEVGGALRYTLHTLAPDGTIGHREVRVV